MTAKRRKRTASPNARPKRDLEARLAEKDRALAECERRNHALCESEQRYKHLFEVASDWFWEADAAGRLSYVSSNIETVLGLPVSAYLGKRLAETEGVSIDADAGRATLDALKARRSYRDFVYSRKLANGQVVWINSSGAPRYGADGAFLGYSGVARDVTAQVEAEHRLQRLERQYRQLFEDSTDSYWEQDVQGRFTHLSSSFETSTGIPVVELLGRRLKEVSLVKVDPKSDEQTLATIKARVGYRNLVQTLVRPDGRLVYVGTSGIPVFGENGEFRGYCGISKDITAQVEAERALRESEQRFRELFEIASDYFWEADEHQRITYLSENYEAVFGIPPSQTLGKRLTETPDVSVDPEMGKMAIAAIRARQPYRDFVYSRKFPDGKTRWFKTSGIPIVDKDGTFRGYRGVGADMTAHVEADQAARLAQSRLHDAVAHVTQPFVFYDAQHRATAFNQAFTDLHREPGGTAPVSQGVSFRELAEWQLRVGFYAEGPDEDEITVDALVEEYESARESTHHLRDGRWMLVVYRRLPGDGRVGLWTDVTEIKRAESERRRLEAQLLHSQRLEALGTLAGGVAHEINNALVPVIALTKLVAGRLPEDSRDRRNLATVMIGAERSRDLVKQILAFSRKEEEGHRRESVDIGAVLRDALQLMRATVPTSIRLEEEIAAVPPVAGDPNQLHQVIVNLVTNAAHAIGEAHGTITVGLRTDADGKALRLSVADTGSGMDAATKARIFEPFFTTKEVGEGTGLGLAVVHGIIKDHGGRIEVESTPGHGTCFDVVLPVTAAVAGAAA
ncbi:MAG TPA: PAS domain S-box protein [Stellaceae bacterium]|nr:PAS domain S-box protein [Stellaceae bacterium]